MQEEINRLLKHTCPSKEQEGKCNGCGSCHEHTSLCLASSHMCHF